ncbi:hypothetical protein [Sphaerimonospora thailandensis]|uniref:Uncharacterized protein n=1 Tax=Sphaerimonospora thailandensis TaxID=795644 RepID=A0A8J3W109_9ACTN|nr:hypothetical protein [Sphaerimonospora thailandensis]GIH71311.1 hypothetical protein Mth01_35640 [Sphaerimonospora thailandensis]
MTPPPTAGSGRVLDASALESAATGKHVYVRALIAMALQSGTVTLLIPVTAYVQALAVIPQDLRWQLMLLTTSPGVEIDLLDDREKAHEIADLGGDDATLAHVAWCGLSRRWPVVSDRMFDLRTLTPALEVEPLP